jgi:hypothetical protein
MSKTLYLVACGAPLAVRVGDGVAEARSQGWDPVVVLTEAAQAWVSPESLSDVPALTDYRRPGEDRRVPAADALAVVPTTSIPCRPGRMAQPTRTRW